MPELAVIWEGGRGCLWWSKSFSIRVAFPRRVADNLLQNEDQVTVTKRCFDRIAAAVVVYNSGKKGKSHAHYTEFTFFQETFIQCFSVVIIQLARFRPLSFALLINGPLKIKKIIKTDKRFKKRMLLTRFELVLLDSKSRVLTTTL